MARRMLPLILVIALAVIPIVAVSAPASEHGRTPPKRWKRDLSQTRYTGIVRSLHHVESKDGTRLTLQLYLPKGLEPRAQIPTLLQITPYAAWDPLLVPFYTEGIDDYWRDFVLRGAAYVSADARGTTGSEGCLDFGGSADRADAQTFARWIKNQEWSDEVIVTDGVSHPGMGSLVAHASVRGLSGALAHAPVVSYYQDEWLQGAKFEDQMNGPLYQETELEPSAYPDPDSVLAQAATCTGKTALDFAPVEGRFTSTWADRDLSRHVPSWETPVLLTHGFADPNVHADHSQLYWDALPDDYPKHAVFGWWNHGWPDMTGHASASPDNFTFTHFRHRWIDSLLFGRKNGLQEEPRVLVEDSRGQWHEGDDWPLEQSSDITLFPGEDALTKAAPARAAVSYVDVLGAKRAEWSGASVEFRSERLKRDRLINGAPTLHLVASSSESATKWVAYLIDEAPNGKRERISHGYADSHTWKGEDSWEPMKPGRRYRWDIQMIPTATVVAEGHRVVLVVASQDSVYGRNRCFSNYDGGCYNYSGIVPSENAGRATNTVHLGPKNTRVSFHWVDPSRTQKPPW